MKFQVANGEVLNAIGVTHVFIQMLGTPLKYLSSFMIWETLIAYLGWMLEKKPISSHVHEQSESGSTQMSMVNQNSRLGVAVILSAIFKQ